MLNMSRNQCCRDKVLQRRFPKQQLKFWVSSMMISTVKKGWVMTVQVHTYNFKICKLQTVRKGTAQSNTSLQEIPGQFSIHE